MDRLKITATLDLRLKPDLLDEAGVVLARVLVETREFDGARLGAVAVEALPGLLSQQSRVDHAIEQWWR